MINIVFWSLLFLFGLVLATAIFWVDSYIDERIQEAKEKYEASKRANWLLKYEIYRRGI